MDGQHLEKIATITDFLPEEALRDEYEDESFDVTPFEKRSHALCQLKILPKDDPTRLIAIGDNDLEVHLCTTRDITKHAPLSYAALTHSWGPAGIKVVTTKKNIGRMLTTIQIKTLGRTFQDAVIATRRLGIPYLWIDCLCIVQDDPRDWIEESARMGSIYANSIVNLVAASAPSRLDGCFNNRSPETTGRVLQLNIRETVDDEATSLYGCVPAEHKHPFEPQNCVTAGRAWCFQETFLAPRSLFFFKEGLAWECRTISASERYPSYRPLSSLSSGARSPKFFRANHWHGQKTGLWSCVADWEILLTYYSQGKLTFPKDKLIAISGVARAMLLQYKSRGFNDIDCGYFAGLWRKDIESQLLWHVREPEKVATALQSPSWSWASVASRVDHAQAMSAVSSNISYQVRVLDVGVNLCSNDSFGEVDGGCLKLSCTQLKPVMIDRHNHTNLGQRSSNNCGTEMTLRWLGRNVPKDRLWTSVFLDSTPNTLGPSTALPVLTQAHDRTTEFGILLREVHSTDKAKIFHRVGYYHFSCPGEYEKIWKVDDVAAEQTIITIV
jgi:hypothetical protein